MGASRKCFFGWAEKDGLPVTWEKLGTMDLGNLLMLCTALHRGKPKGWKTQRQDERTGQNGKKAPGKGVFRAIKDSGSRKGTSSLFYQSARSAGYVLGSLAGRILRIPA